MFLLHPNQQLTIVHLAYQRTSVLFHRHRQLFRQQIEGISNSLQFFLLPPEYVTSFCKNKSVISSADALIAVSETCKHESNNDYYFLSYFPHIFLF